MRNRRKRAIVRKARKQQTQHNEILRTVPHVPAGMTYKVTGDDFTMLVDHGGVAQIAAQAIAQATGKRTFTSLGNQVILENRRQEAQPRRRGRPRNDIVTNR